MNRLKSIGLIAILILLSTDNIYAIKGEKLSRYTRPSQYKFRTEGDQHSGINIAPGYSKPSKIHYPVNRSVNAVLVDSSVNGYGVVVGMTNPIYYHPDNGIIMGYRQWRGPWPESSSGYIGAAYSPDGIDFTTYGSLNTIDPAEIVGRYPSAVGGSDYPYIIWNEYTTSSGGGEFGGRPLYSWDQFFYGGGSFFTPPVDINNGCSPSPCDPMDNWVGCAILNEVGGTPVVNITYSAWSGTVDNALLPIKYLYHSVMHASGYFIFNDAYALYSGEEFEENTTSGSYTSNATIDINESGVGYSAVISYFKGVITTGAAVPPDSAHTFMIRKTTDYGETWSSTGFNGSNYFYISDFRFKQMFLESGLMPPSYTDDNDSLVVFDGAYIPYDFDLKVDADGGLHIFSAVIPTSGGFLWWAPGCSFYHMYNPDPSDSTGWVASEIGAIDVSFQYSHGGTSNYFRLFPSAGTSIDDPNVMYATYEALSDTSEAAWNYDVYVSRSVDAGATWSEPMNITNTVEWEVDEIHPHMSPTATDTSCFIMYMGVDWETFQDHSSSDSTVPEDYKQRIWYTEVNFGDVSIENVDVFPQTYRLAQNYPNPFNAETVIQYQLGQESDVSLTVYDILGKEVVQLKNGIQEAGSHTVVWDASNVSAGVYYYRLITEGYSKTKKMILLK